MMFLAYLQSLIEPIGEEAYGLFETEARQRLRGRTRTIKLNIEQSPWMESLNGSRNNFILIEFDWGGASRGQAVSFELDTAGISRRSRLLYDLALAA